MKKKQKGSFFMKHRVVLTLIPVLKVTTTLNQLIFIQKSLTKIWWKSISAHFRYCVNSITNRQTDRQTNR